MVVKSHRGLHDWLTQRVSAVLIGLYALFIVIYLLGNASLQYVKWHTLFSQWWMQIATIIVILAVLWHAWIGLWTVITDYIKNRTIRLIVQSLVILILLVYGFWGITILF